jgi:hypothetical protein
MKQDDAGSAPMLGSPFQRDCDRQRLRVIADIKCDNNGGYDCRVKGSVRNACVALIVDDDSEDPDYWAHMTPHQARRLAAFLAEAADEADRRIAAGLALPRYRCR